MRKNMLWIHTNKLPNSQQNIVNQNYNNLKTEYQSNNADLIHKNQSRKKK